ncbi:MAG: hypothetical protein HRU24_07305 [Gammaproteobacteria bacterium]|nr:hypothetical protein [Gammaproteobacteria bacterium]
MAALDKHKVKNLSAEDMRDFMYGEIQKMIEGNSPKNVAFQYFMPPINFGPELVSFMEIGPQAKKLTEQGFTVNDVMRSAINFAAIVDCVPLINHLDSGSDIVDINALTSSGIILSNVYESILKNCRVFNNERSDADKEKLKKLRSLLYVDTQTQATQDPAATQELSDDDLLAGFDDDESDFDLNDILGDEPSLLDIVADPNAISLPTVAMKLYEALMNNYEQTLLAALDQLKKVSPNDPNGSVRIKLLKKKIRAAEQRWEAQGRKTKIESILARIEHLSQGGMVEYVADLRNRFAGSQMHASIFSDEEFGSSLLAESAYYTALRPNGVLSAPSHLKVSLSNKNSATWSSFKSSKSSAGVKAPMFGVFGRSSGGGDRSKENKEDKFFEHEFTISFEIVQGLIDRQQWFNRSFVECRAYTTVDLKTEKALDPIMEITQLSDGGIPPKAGMVPAIPNTVYFIRNLKVTSKSLAKMSKDEQASLSGKADVSIFGWGAKGSHEKTTITTQCTSDETSGTIEANGTYLIGMASVYLKKSPNPDFESFPKDQWI